MDYVRVNDKLSAVLLSNRCAAYLNLKKYEDALEDAERCVQIEPDWSKVQYLFLSCCFFYWLGNLGNLDTDVLYD